MAKDHQLLENSCAKVLRVPGLVLVFLPLPDSVPLVQGQDLELSLLHSALPVVLELVYCLKAVLPEYHIGGRVVRVVDSSLELFLPVFRCCQG